MLDVFEHAFMIDYGLIKADCCNAFFENINWKVAEGRLKKTFVNQVYFRDTNLLS